MERRTIDEIQVAAEPGAWRAAGFNVAGHVCEVGSARLRPWARARAAASFRGRCAGPAQAPAGTKVASDPHGPARLWEISFLVDNLDETAVVLGDLLSEPRAAVQPGRSSATLGGAARLGPAVAFMTPGPGAI